MYENDYHNCLEDTCLEKETDDSARAVFDADKVLGDIHATIKRNRRSRLRNRMSLVFASLFLPMAAGMIFLLTRRDASSDAMAELRSAPGTVASITLPDSTRIWLNSDSRISYPLSFSGDTREVYLDGECYFKVAKNEKQPFLVHSNDMTVKVTGTEFNVEAYDLPGRNITTTLVQGSVTVLSDGNDPVHMRPGQSAELNTDDGSISVTSVDTRVATAWKDGRLVFSQTPFAEALRMIENRFNVAFEIENPQLNNLRFTGVFKSQGLESILASFTISENIHFQRANPTDTQERELITVR